jgi:hypothetical protein
MATNGFHVSSEHQQDMRAIFPEALSTLQEADPELAEIIKDEQRRQWCALAQSTGSPCAGGCAWLGRPPAPSWDRLPQPISLTGLSPSLLTAGWASS